MINLLHASLFNLRHHRATASPKHRVFVLIDAAADLEPSEYVRCVRAWSSWVSIQGAVKGDRAALIALAGLPAVREATIVVVVSHDIAVTGAVKLICERAGQVCVDATIAPQGSRELALFQEVLHHDLELGGWNEWTGSDSQFGASVLRMISTVHTRRAYPQYVDAHLARLQQQNGGEPIQALDVGCGAISRLRWGALNGVMTVTGVDPLLDMYAIVRERHGLNVLPNIRCAHDVCAGAEGLRDRLVPGTFHFAYCANALDHTEDPVAVVEAIGSVLRPGGLLAIEVFTREGSRENWWQLHQFDMYANDARVFVCETRDGVVRPVFPDGCGLAVREFVVNNDVTTALIAERVTG